MPKRAVFPWVLVVLLAAAAAILLFRGCGKGPVAVVNGAKITEDEFYARLEKVAGQGTLQDMIVREIIDQEATAQGIVIPQEQIDAKFDQIRSQFSNPADFARWLSSSGQTEEDFRNSIAFGMRLQALLSKGVTVTEDEARAFFEQHHGDWDQPELFHFLEIVTDTKDEAERVLARAKEPDADFQALARSFSQSQITRPSGGDFGTWPLARIFPAALRPRLAEMKEGEIAGPIGPADREGKPQFWVIKLLSRKPAVKASFDDPQVREQVMERAKMEKSKTETQLFDELKGKYNVHILWPEYSFMNDRFRGANEIPEFGTPGPAPTPTPAPARPPAAPAPANAPAAPSGASGTK